MLPRTKNGLIDFFGQCSHPRNTCRDLPRYEFAKVHESIEGLRLRRALREAARR